MNQLPLCVDCDGTLIHSDLLHESFLLLLKRHFLQACRVPVWLLRGGKAGLKLEIAQRVAVDVTTLPYDERVVQYLREQRAAGRHCVLVTASAKPYAQSIAEHLQLFDEVLATDSLATNLSAANKAAELSRRFGSAGFEYLGNSADDLPVWRDAGRVSVANAPRGVLSAARALGRPGVEFASRGSVVAAMLRACRPHQWLKNLLILLPLLAAHKLGDAALLLQALWAFVAFACCASSVYVLNDLLDIEADRRHPRKRRRPFASGNLPIPMGLALVPLLLLASLLVTLTLPPLFGLVLLIYFVTTLAYSFRLKAQVMVDVMLLSALYTMRVLAGAAAVHVAPSFWLLAFSMFMFLSLALVKRYAEMRSLIERNEAKAAGRGYGVPDMSVLMAIGVASGYNTLLVLALYLNSADVQALYKTPQLLWLIVPLMAYWIGRVWLKTHRGEMHDDPVVFAAKDWQSIVVGLLVLLIGLSASLGLA